MSENLRPPQPPAPTRLNRRVLIVAAVTLGVTLLATAYTLTHSGPARPPASRVESIPTPDRPAEPRFLERPPATTQAQQERLRALVDGTDPLDSPTQEPYPSEAFDPFSTAEVPAPPPPPPPADPRQEALARALASPLQPGGSSPSRIAISPSLVGSGPGPELFAAPAAVPASPGGGNSLAPSSPALPYPPLPDLAAVRDLLTPPAPAPAEEPADPHERFLARAARGARAAALDLERPATPYRLAAGTVLPAALLTAVRSDLPGSVVAQLTRDVYDPSQTYLLLPRGSRLLGLYDSQVSRGQDRLLLAWHRILLPDGSSLRLPALAGATPSGEAGLPGHVNAHTGRLVGNALLLSIVSAGLQLSQPQESATAGQAPSARQIAAGAVGQELGTLAVEITRRNLDLRPTISLAAGQELHVHVTADLHLPGPYAP